MAWRFKASKYKNAVPVVPKPENCIRDITIGSYQTYGNNIISSAAFMAFNTGQNGSSLAVLPLDDSGRKGKDMALLHAHTDTVTDMSFSPFHDGLLATGSQDCLIKVWHIPKLGLESSLSEPECVLYSKTQRRVETVLFHPIADCLLSTTSFTTLNLWDMTTQQAIYNNAEDHAEVIQCISWNDTGSLIATTCKDKQLRILDCRKDRSVIHETTSHQGIKDSRALWLNDGFRLLTTGFSGAREREICIRDIRKIDTPEKSIELDSSTGPSLKQLVEEDGLELSMMNLLIHTNVNDGDIIFMSPELHDIFCNKINFQARSALIILIPLYDSDTNMLFLAGKGDTSIFYMEVTNREPYLIEGLRHNGEQTKGACLVPKRALNVMQGEVNRVLQLTSSMVIPIMYQVPRKTYRDFHADLFPDTTGCTTDLSADEWFSGKNSILPKISLDPSKKTPESGVLHRGTLWEICSILNKKTLKSVEKVTVKESVSEGIETTKKKVAELTDGKNHALLRESSFTRNGAFVDEEGMCENGKAKELDAPPKPKPRSSRSNSVDFVEDRPIAKPRTHKNSIDSVQGLFLEKTDEEDCLAGLVIEKIQPCVIQSVNPNLPISGGYKPRLGPKPFTPPKLQSYSTSIDKPLLPESKAFDKVFTAPCLPQNEKLSNSIVLEGNYGDMANLEKLSIYECEINDFSKITENNKIYEKNSIDLDKVCNKTNERNLGYGDVCEKIENNFDKPLKKVPNMDENIDKFKRKMNESPLKNGEAPQEEDFVPKTPSMAERRKLFETGRGNSGTDEKEMPDGVCSSKSAENIKEEPVMERGSTQRSSIAERRKVYESRKASVQEQGVTVDKTSPTPLRRRSSFKAKQEDAVEEPVNRRATLGGPIRSEKSGERKEISTPTPKRTSTVFGRVSKFRHLKGTPAHKSTFIENIRNVSRQVTGECDGFHANSERVAVPQSGPGGKIAVFELSKTGRLPDVVTPTLVHGTTVMDFCWDPFDNQRLAVACDDGIVRLWKIPSSGLAEPTNKPDAILTCHSDKIYCTKFHPLAKDVLVTASYDMTIKIWDLNAMQEKLSLAGHTDQIFCLAWSPCGRFLATACKDVVLRVFNPRHGLQPIRQGKGPSGTRGARIVWALDGACLVVLGFDKVSERQIMVFKANDLSQPLTTVGLDVSPAILMPFYDEDSSTLFLTGRGDSTIYTFEVTEESPYVCPLSHHRCASLHQGLSFLSKKDCDVASVEFAKALRLSNNTIEPLSFTVPRIKSELFQDDLFPPTKVTWEATMSSSEWFAGANKQARRISLKPANMESLSAAGSVEKTSAKNSSTLGLNTNSHYSKYNPEFQDCALSKQEQIQRAVSNKMEVNMSLEQDRMEGVDEHEWDE